MLNSIVLSVNPGDEIGRIATSFFTLVSHDDIFKVFTIGFIPFYYQKCREQVNGRY